MIDPQGYIVINEINSPIVTDLGINYIEKNSKRYKIKRFFLGVWEVIKTFNPIFKMKALK